MDDRKLGAVEARFADIVWRSEPLSSGELVRLCEKELCWKKSTTYTVLRKLCERGLFQNRDGVVSSRISRQDFYAMQGAQLVEEAFEGSLPAFFAAFTKRKQLTPDEITQLRGMIDSYEEG